MAFDQVVHHYAKAADTNLYSITRITPLIRLGALDEVVLLQEGKIMDEGGDIIPEHKFPGWLYDELAKMTPFALSEVGLKELPKRPEPPKDTMIAADAAKPDPAKVGGSETLHKPPLNVKV